MKTILHISAECYPAAKVGGLADVVGSLPRYLGAAGSEASVIIPKYHTPWITSRKRRLIHEDRMAVEKGAGDKLAESRRFAIEQVEDGGTGFPLYLVDIPGLFDRPGIYSDPSTGTPYPDEIARFFTFQMAVLEWVLTMEEKPGIIHCHDHHTALVPFLMTRTRRYRRLAAIPTVLTLHNAEYQGIYDLKEHRRLPAFDPAVIGLLDWDGRLNSLASGIKCAWRVTTVSQGYLKELMEQHPLGSLLQQERSKTTGITNGIDTELWNPETDPWLTENYTVRSRKSGKRANKKVLCREWDLDPERPLFSFIGRLAREKGADLLPALVRRMAEELPESSLMILGTGDPQIQRELASLKKPHRSFLALSLEYNEELAHRIYAASDFLLMPSRVEPCGLNQMYAMRYGTVPVVRATGGLADTVIDLDQPGGYGIRFRPADTDAIMGALHRAAHFCRREEAFDENRKRVMQLDFSWERVATQYKKLYKELS